MPSDAQISDFTITGEPQLLWTRATPTEAGNRRTYPDEQGVWAGNFYYH